MITRVPDTRNGAPTAVVVFLDWHVTFKKINKKC